MYRQTSRILIKVREKGLGNGSFFFSRTNLTLVGIKFAHEWTAEQYAAFLAEGGWRITKSEIVKGRIDLMYVECEKD